MTPFAGAGLQAAPLPSACPPRSRCLQPAAAAAAAAAAASKWAAGHRPRPATAAAGATPRLPPARHAIPRRSAQAAAGGGGSQDAEAPTAAVAEHVRAAAALVANTFFRDEIAIGVGSGLGVTYVLEELAQRLGAGKLRGVRCVPASDAAAGEAAFLGVPLTTLQVRGRPRCSTCRLHTPPCNPRPTSAALACRGCAAACRRRPAGWICS